MTLRFFIDLFWLLLPFLEFIFGGSLLVCSVLLGYLTVCHWKRLSIFKFSVYIVVACAFWAMGLYFLVDVALDFASILEAGK